MDESVVFQKVLEIVSPFARNKEALVQASAGTTFLRDMKVNSARLVDIILRIEEAFDIEIDDDDADQVRTMGDAVKLILAKAA